MRGLAESAKRGISAIRTVLTFKDVKLWPKRYEAGIKRSREKLLEERGNRPRAFTDDKIVTEYNGLMIHSMAMAFQAFGEHKYLDAAIASAKFIKERLYKDGKLRRYYRAGAAPGQAILDDYAFLIQGLITLYESTFDESWLTWALELQEKKDELFRDEATGSYFLSDAGLTDVLVRGRGVLRHLNPKLQRNDRSQPPKALRAYL